MLKKKLCFLGGVMLLLSLVSYGICLAVGESKQMKQNEEILVVTSFYPMYVLVENLVEDLDKITVSNLTENQTGCLHDYQLTAKDMKLLSNADVFVINGGGMELFMDKVLSSYSQLPIINASLGIELLEGTGHSHSHNHGEEEEDAHIPADETDIHETEDDFIYSEENGHIWLDVERYRQQLETITEKLSELVPSTQAEALWNAKAEYDNQLQELSDNIAEVKLQTKGMPVVIFHEAFAYLAESLDMEVLMALSLDEETVPSAGEIAEVIEEIRYHGMALVLIEESHADYADKILAETQAKVVYLDPLVTGDGAADSYVVGMWENMESIQAAVSAE